MKQRTDLVVMYSKLQDMKRRSDLNRPSLFPGSKLNSKLDEKNTSRKWRVKIFTVSILPSRKLTFTLRRFRTSKAWRATRPGHIALHPWFIPVKEVTIRYKNLSRRKRKNSRYAGLLARYSHLSWLIILFGIGGAIYFGVQAKQGPSIDPGKPFSVPTVAATDDKVSIVPRVQGLAKSEPTHVKMPTVGIDSGVMPVGKNPDGTMETPPLFEHITGWYKLGPTPGEVGPAIIVGHVDTYKGPSVFWRLRDLKPGDIVEVTRQDGQIVKFKVSSLKQVDQNNFPTEEIYGNVDYPALRLITCGGAFNKKTGHYTENTVVFASKV